MISNFIIALLLSKIYSEELIQSLETIIIFVFIYLVMFYRLIKAASKKDLKKTKLRFI